MSEGRQGSQNKKAAGSLVQARACPDRARRIPGKQSLKILSEVGCGGYPMIDLYVPENLTARFQSGFPIRLI